MFVPSCSWFVPGLWPLCVGWSRMVRAWDEGVADCYTGNGCDWSTKGIFVWIRRTRSTNAWRMYGIYVTMKVVRLGSLTRSSVLLGSTQWNFNSLLKWNSRLYSGNYEGCVAVYLYRNLWAFRINLLLPSSRFWEQTAWNIRKGRQFLSLL
jgi:hypothetical protein